MNHVISINHCHCHCRSFITNLRIFNTRVHVVYCLYSIVCVCVVCLIAIENKDNKINKIIIYYVIQFLDDQQYYRTVVFHCRWAASRTSKLGWEKMLLCDMPFIKFFLILFFFSLIDTREFFSCVNWQRK